MLSATDRYIARLIAVPLFSTLVISAMLLVLEKMLRLFDFVASEGGPVSVVWRMLVNLIPEYLSLGIPIGLMLGILFALAFCPTSAVFYFGMLIPMSAVEPMGYFLPAVFAVATSLPVIIVAWILAYSVAGIGKFYTRMQAFEKWFRLIVALIFMFVGMYYTWIFWIK